ncbi:AAA family ATPase [Carboxylicivirga taeanensis]|uniref:AAA family ATPase n=1 Tax=Carboxylicivirga taeanensis TaxID=1416875 RepID=UPI003F6DBDF5
MKISSFKLIDFKPIKNIEIDNLGDVVIIAGANGSGKTRLKQAIVQSIQNTPIMDLTIQATRKDEAEKYFNGHEVKLINRQQNQQFKNYINSRKYGQGKYVGSLVQIDSKRTLETISYNQISYQVVDPDDTETPWNWGYSPFVNRWREFMNYIHQKVAAHKNKLAEAVQADPSQTGTTILQNYPHPLEKYKLIFKNILPGKILQDINPAQPNEFHYKDGAGQILPFSSLSSGEQEVIKVLFDVARKDIKHSVFIIDEPELHLHPTLTFKLIEALKSIGEHTNQFIFLTHSADLISTYYATGNVFFIDSDQSGQNQAHRLSELKTTHKELVQLIGENLGLFAVGKKIVFIEGESSSIDRLAYHKIAQKVDSEIKVNPIGSVTNIGALKAVEEQIRQSIFGVNMYMVRDRDGLRQEQITSIEASGHIFCLKRRHIENYFLDEEILRKVVVHLYLDKNKDLTEEFIKIETKRIATETLSFNLIKNFKDYLSANYSLKAPKVNIGNNMPVDTIINEILDGFEAEINKLTVELDRTKTERWLKQEKVRLENLLSGENWENEFQGKPIFARLCGEILKADHVRIRECYIDIALEHKPEILKDLIQIFEKIK